MNLDPAEKVDVIERRGIRAVSMLGTVSLSALSLIGLKHGVDQVLNPEIILPFQTELDGVAPRAAVGAANFCFASFTVGLNTLGVGFAGLGALVMNRIRHRYPDNLAETTSKVD